MERNENNRLTNKITIVKNSYNVPRYFSKHEKPKKEAKASIEISK